MKSQESLRTVRLALIAAGVALVGLAGVMAWFILQPAFAGVGVAPAEAPKLSLPAYDLAPWNRLPVQMSGRVMPFETAAINALRQVTGRSKFEKQDAVAVVLSWMMTRGAAATGLPNWEETPVILCDDPRLRGPILTDALSGSVPDGLLHGKFLSPKQVRNSKALRELLNSAREKRRLDPERASQTFTPEERTAEEVMERLRTFDSFTQGDPVVTIGVGHLKPRDPLHVAALDVVKDSPWLSLGDMSQCLEDKSVWQAMLLERMTATPHLYLAPERQAALRAFQEQVKAGKESEALEALEKKLSAERQQRVAAFRAIADKSPEAVRKFLDTEALQNEAELLQFEKFLKTAAPDPKSSASPMEQLAQKLDAILKEGQDRKLQMLAQEAARARKIGYLPEKDEFRTLHMAYLETLYPKMYAEAVQWQAFPEAKARRLQAEYVALQSSYLSQKPLQFAEASQRWFAALAQVSKEAEPTYPSCSTLDLELRFNRLEPFKWAWVTMSLAALCFALSLGFTSRLPYIAGFLFFLTSLAFQGFGYYARVTISGRPPVTNMYETVIFVASMAAIFALILELAYRPRYIALAGSIVATIGLVLADQLPVSRGFDAAIQPLVPVLRSNFWLIIHVMTIVASYAGGALAWCMGNIVLFMYFFREPKPADLKRLSQLTYRSMQIAVLLLAAGTFLGGWWAAYSWGRFWGWDPKETWALIALIAYVIPLHMRFIGWVKDFGLAVSAVVCFSAIVMSWYGVNFILGAGLHSYGFGGGGPYYVYLGCLLNLIWVVAVCLKHVQRQSAALEEAVRPAAPAMVSGKAEAYATV